MAEVDRLRSIMIFCDGACSGNPGKGGWGTIVATPDGHVRELGGPAASTTNNKMEMTAALRGLQFVAERTEPVDVYTDSVYVIRGITQWIWGWRARGWKTAEGGDVANRELWMELLQTVSRRPKSAPIHWHFVRGHVGTPGNERCDEIAVKFSKGQPPRLYDGSLLQYGVAIHDIPDDTSLPEPKPREEKPAGAYSYLSVVDGVPMRHKTWRECEARVKGRSGARFKKALSEDGERSILAGWGFAPKDLR